MPFEILQVTAAYSNAVLVAIMPHVSNFAKTLDLPIPQPVTIAQVKKFGCSPRADHIGGRVVLTNDYSFTFDLGAVVLYRSPHSYYSLQDPDRLPEFYGTVKVKKDEAINIAHNALKKLGYSDSELFLDLKPKVTPPKRNEGKEIARYLVEWINPENVTAGGIPLERTAVEIDASTGRIEMLGIQTKLARRPDPKLDVHPPVLMSAPKSQPVGGGIQMQHVGKAFEQAFLAAILPQISDFVEKSGVNVKIPITINDVDMPHYECWYDKTRGLVVVLYLRTGDRFWYEHGRVIEFEAAEAERWIAPNSPYEDKPREMFFGPVNLSSNEALAAVRKAVKGLGWEQVTRLKERPEIVPPRKYGTNYFARYFFNWWPHDRGMQVGVAEVNATTKRIVSLYIDDGSNPQIWREPPKIDVPPMIETNAPEPRPSQPTPALPPPSLPPPTPLKRFKPGGGQTLTGRHPDPFSSTELFQEHPGLHTTSSCNFRKSAKATGYEKWGLPVNTQLFVRSKEQSQLRHDRPMPKTGEMRRQLKKSAVT